MVVYTNGQISGVQEFLAMNFLTFGLSVQLLVITLSANFPCSNVKHVVAFDKYIESAVLPELPY